MLKNPNFFKTLLRRLKMARGVHSLKGNSPIESCHVANVEESTASFLDMN